MDLVEEMIIIHLRDSHTLHPKEIVLLDSYVDIMVLTKVKIPMNDKLCKKLA